MVFVWVLITHSAHIAIFPSELNKHCYRRIVLGY